MTLDWERVTSLFGAARTLDARARQTFLDAACGSDRGLRAEVEALLDADADDSFLERGLNPALREMASPVAGRLAPGDLLKDRYRIERPLGGGGQALVYGAVDLVLSRAVVVKVMRAAGLANRWLKSRFEREMQALSRIDHPGVVGILDVGDLDDGSPFLVIQHVEGCSLREALDGGPLDVARTAGILRQLGSALAAAHAAGVAHQDLKPENIMLQRSAEGSDTVKLIDFGIAKIDRADVEGGLTTVMVAGTVRYMAPEQFRGENSPACDVYALALVTCEMLCGEPDARALAGHAGGRTRRLIDAALARRPERRPSDIRHWCEDVADSLARGRRVRRQLWLGLAATALVLATLAIGVRVLLPYLTPPVRIIEKVGAFDPTYEGFTARHGVTGTVAYDPEGNVYEAWRAIGSGAGDYYYMKLTPAQKRLAMERGWTLVAVMRRESGFTFAGLDFAGYGKRYDITLFGDSDTEVVRLQTRLVPTFEGLDLRLPYIPNAYHRYELRYDPSLQSATLWIDGKQQLTNYKGHTQFQDDMGLIFGATPYRSEKGSGAFKSVRFEINP